ncbi:methyltransferase domain protein [Asticcacaulis biprosthecium C19]|uniref:Methyltransferase domain protein n=1 Tax=Asticcacaulis biprosthecium C19 TaxID=715226 RepID=F4QRQ9_9CAUL|nr:class I SAM-dependent methyltransferase [Asticcacaulis biprosthecium]EGF89429.1 methyltransferase domain protein [Asticcacaulis biprosthecium C19]
MADPQLCRFCNRPLNRIFLDLGETPLANSYLKAEALDRPEPSYLLMVRLCDDCLLVQAQPVVPADHIFSDYAYFSSFSSSWLKHAQAYSHDMIERLKLDGQSFVVEIASNDGYLLRNFVAAGIPCLGIEPAENVAEAARAQGVPTEAVFFGADTARRVVAERGPADLMAANNVLAHVPDLNDFVAGFKILLAPTGTVTIEFPHVLQLIRHVQFDTIYHEHYSYFSLVTLNRVFAHHGLTLFDAQALPTHGGSLRIFVCHSDDPRAGLPTERLLALRREESDAGLDTVDGYSGMADKVAQVVTELRQFLGDARRDGKSVAAYGAAAKGNTLLNVAGIGSDQILFVADRSPHKQDHLLPGSHIPIVAPERIAEVKPDYLLVLPWNLIDEIRADWKDIAAWGGRFVTAIPQLKVW